MTADNHSMYYNLHFHQSLSTVIIVSSWS